MTPTFRPRYISFDCYGTLISFRIREATVPLISDRLDAAGVEAFMDRFRIYRLDQVLEYAPYDEIIEAAYRRTCARFGLEVRDGDIAALTSAVLTWGAHEDVVSPLRKIAEHFPLVILSNADDRHLAASVPRLGAPFHAVLTAEQAQAYKPRYQAFEYMFDTLDATPEDFLHISSHQRYDHMPAFDLGIRDKVLLDRGYDPDLPHYGAVRMDTLDEVAKALGI
ncbi:haloacid dehalogenase type II [Microbacterium betulae]|uniref:Haloacid dehalogenase type II n=1 Tax=Microbacterium betulae TaxID=2981139 RepID=A0AA97FHZ2_9MICO|nr:haloacid dehalogenase type II [Microbacterium sp. AB]WOF23380.1 haloacid dehalogenase type II [Microbacterium sp. AB]